MAYKKPQDPLTNNGFGIYPLTTADQVILSDGSRLEKVGKINADKLDGRTLAEIMLEIYPVGAIYTSTVATSPASLFGGTWEQLKDRFLLGAGGSYSAGGMGGEATHKLTTSFTASKNWTGSTSSVGDNGAHNNMPPYLAVYMWKRVS